MKNIRKPLYRCICSKCKAIFDAEYEDFETEERGYTYRKEYLATKCPICGKEIEFSDETIKTIYPRKAKESEK